MGNKKYRKYNYKALIFLGAFFIFITTFGVKAHPVSASPLYAPEAREQIAAILIKLEPLLRALIDAIKTKNSSLAQISGAAIPQTEDAAENTGLPQEESAAPVQIEPEAEEITPEIKELLSEELARTEELIVCPSEPEKTFAQQLEEEKSATLEDITTKTADMTEKAAKLKQLEQQAATLLQDDIKKLKELDIKIKQTENDAELKNLRDLQQAVIKSHRDELRKIRDEIKAGHNALKSLANDRKRTLKATMRTDPDGAFAAILTDRARSDMETLTSGCTEQRVEIVGKLKVAHADLENGKDWRKYILTGANKREFILHPAFALGGTPLKPNATFAIRGFAIDNDVLVNTDRILEGSTDSSATVLAEEPAKNLPHQGDVRLLLIPVKLLDTTAPLAADMNNLVTELKQYYKETSYGIVNVIPTVHSVVSMPVPSGTRACATTQPGMDLIFDILKAIDPTVNFNNYDGFSIIMNNGSGYNCGYSGIAFIENVPIETNEGTVYKAVNQTLYPNTKLAGTTLHEVGHSFGNLHASFHRCNSYAVMLRPSLTSESDYSDPELNNKYNPNQMNGSKCHHFEYFDLYDAMGSAALKGTFSAAHRDRLGWLDSSSIATVTAPGTFTLVPLETASSGLKALKIQRTTTDYMYIEYRQPIGYDTNLLNIKPGFQLFQNYNLTDTSDVFEGALLHITSFWRPPNTSIFDPTHTITEAKSYFPYKVALKPGQSYTDPWTGTVIKVLSRDSGSLKVEVTPGTPDITGVSAEIISPKEGGTARGGTKFGINPNSGTFLSSGGIELAAKVDEGTAESPKSDPMRFYFFINGALYTKLQKGVQSFWRAELYYTGNPTVKHGGHFDTKSLPNGQHRIWVFSEDWARNVSISPQIPFFIDNPITEQTKPKHDSWYIRNPEKTAIYSFPWTNITGTFFDENAVARSELFQDKNTTPLVVYEQRNGEAGSYPKPDSSSGVVTKLSPGTHSFWYAGYDIAGNRMVSPTTFFDVVPYQNADTIPPDIKITEPANNSTVKDAFRFTVEFKNTSAQELNSSYNSDLPRGFQAQGNPMIIFDDDLLSGPLGYYLSESPVLNASMFINSQGLTNGPHTMKVSACDKYGNCAKSSPVHIIVNNPVPTITKPTIFSYNGQVVYGNGVIFSVFMTTPYKTISYEFFIDGSSIGTKKIRTQSEVREENLGEEESISAGYQVAYPGYMYRIKWDSRTVPNGTHSLTVKALYDNGTIVESDPMSVIVDNAHPSLPDHAPFVFAGYDQAIGLNGTVELDASVSDDGLPNPPGALTISWSAVSKPINGTVVFSSPSTKKTNATFSKSGIYKLRVTAYDGNKSVKDELVVEVSPPPDPVPNIPPKVSAGLDNVIWLEQRPSPYYPSYPYDGFLPGAGRIRDDGKLNPPGNNLTYWRQISGPVSLPFSSPANFSPSFKNALSGKYVFRLTRSDGEFNASDDAELEIQNTVKPPAPPSPDGAYLFSGGINYPHNIIKVKSFPATEQVMTPPTMVKYWPATSVLAQISGPGKVTFSTAPGPYGTTQTFATFPSEGSYLFRTTATTTFWTTYHDTIVAVKRAFVKNNPPVADAGFFQYAAPGQTIALEGLATDDGLPSKNLSYSWSLDRGPAPVTFSDSSQQNASVTFPSAKGSYRIRLTVSDGQFQDIDHITVEVR